MIRVSYSRIHEEVFRRYVLRLMARHFNSVRLLGEPPLLGDEAVLLLPNHSTWWDGFFIYLLKEKLYRRRRLYLMMLEEQLRRHRFFSRVGAYSIDPQSVSETLESLRYTKEVLSYPEKPLLCIFPQGELLPWAVRPLRYKRGISLLLKQLAGPVRVILTAIRCEFLASQRADVFIRLCDMGVHTSERPLASELLSIRHEALLDELVQMILAGEPGQLLLKGKPSINETVLEIRRRVGLYSEAQT